MKILDYFKLSDEKEAARKIYTNIEDGVEFKGTNLWILIFAVFIASLGLNVNSTAVVIGAMLVSPLMGPILGIGFGMAINDLKLLRKSLFSILSAAATGLATSTIYFFLSPINDAHSEILARTSPNIYDVLIAFFGGLAGMLATSSKLKGNVIPGVAIATALMPPLCTAGYGLATFQFEFFFGAFYLFIINTVFIALATLIMVRFMNIHYRNTHPEENERRAKWIMYIIVIATLLPSIYFGYDQVRKNTFQKRANAFIDKEANFPNDYLLKRKIDAREKSITLTYGGDIISPEAIESLRNKLRYYELDSTTLNIQQGFAFLQPDNKEVKQISVALSEKDMQIQRFNRQLDSLNRQNEMGKQVFRELQAQYPAVQTFILQRGNSYSAAGKKSIWISHVGSTTKLNEKDRNRVKSWLEVRLDSAELQIHFTP